MRLRMNARTVISEPMMPRRIRRCRHHHDITPLADTEGKAKTVRIACARHPVPQRRRIRRAPDDLAQRVTRLNRRRQIRGILRAHDHLAGILRLEDQSVGFEDARCQSPILQEAPRGIEVRNTEHHRIHIRERHVLFLLNRP